MKRFLLVLALTMAMLGSIAVPAQAATNPNYILNCAKDGTGPSCGTQYAGIQAIVKIQDLVLGLLDGQSVTSVYLTPSYNDVCYGASHCNFIEVGWSRNRNVFYEDPKVFFIAVANGITVQNISLPAPAYGDYIFSLSRSSVDGYYAVAGEYKPVGGGPNSWTLVGAHHPSPWWKGMTITAVETVNNTSGSYDRVSAFHKYVVVQKSADFTWKAANYDNNAALYGLGDTLVCYTQNYIAGSNNTGDTIEYVKTCA